MGTTCRHDGWRVSQTYRMNLSKEAFIRTSARRHKTGRAQAMDAIGPDYREKTHHITSYA